MEGQHTLEWRERLYRWIEKRSVHQTIIAIIILNAVILGLETVPSVNREYGDLLYTIDRACLAVFVVEILLALVALGPKRFFRDPWRVFDFVVVGIALIPATGAFSILRSLRILKVLKLVSSSPRMRSVVSALLSAVPGLSAIISLLLLLFYVSAVMSTKLFGHDFPEWFGSISASMYTLFQIMTLESWSMGIVRPVLEVHPYAWIFFVPFIMIATFTMLNLFIAVIVDAMQSQAREAQSQQIEELEHIADMKEQKLHDDIDDLRHEVRELKAIVLQALDRQNPPQ
ncbi:ion transporter [Chrysiogenes arsenatis]|uniref:ion transporter n=1 Tax=Chrysiogenes arsenatis TaxID=309797 RepID=UPI00041ABA63|nr:ion transporter [Chrysiogenes arsenatis]